MNAHASAAGAPVFASGVPVQYGSPEATMRACMALISFEDVALVGDYMPAPIGMA